MERRLILDKIETEYLRLQIDSGDNLRIKSGLQSLSQLYRKGRSINPSHLNGVVNSVTATAYRKTIDVKVRRWVLNALARIGHEGMCLPAIQHLIKNHPEEPETIAAGIAALYKLCVKQDPEEILAGVAFDPQMRTLAALQHVPLAKVNLKELPLNVEKATSVLLKLALLVVGLNRSPENLLNPRHSDAEMVKALGRHHDADVVQYSIWAVTEHESLHLKHLGIDLTAIESHPNNVRAWLYKLLASEITNTDPHWEYIHLGMNDPNQEARLGLATGLKNTYLDLVEPLVMSWVTAESDFEIRQHIFDHMVYQSERSNKYLQYAIEIYDSEPAGSLIRLRMEACAVSLPIYAKFKQIGAGSPDLFGENFKMTTNNYHIGNINAGAVAFGESKAVNHGAVNSQTITQQQIESAQTKLAQLQAAVYESDLSEVEKKKALSLIQQAKEEPSKTNIEGVVHHITSLGSLAEATTALLPYAVALGKIFGF